MKRVLRKNTILLQTLVSLAISILIGMYVNVLTSYISSNAQATLLNAISRLSYWNVFILLSFILLFFQIYITSIPSKDLKNIKKDIIEQILESACKAIVYPNNHLHIRAVITICDYRKKVRKTIYTYNFETDPERTATFPLFFGVTGEALKRRTTIFKELSTNHIESYESNVQFLISEDLKSILAAPIFDPYNPHGKIIGILAFDSFEPIDTIKFNNRESMNIAQSWADTISQLLVI